MLEKVVVNIYYTGNNFNAYAPDLTGCVSTAATLNEKKKNIKEAIEFHIESSIANNETIPDIFKGDYELEYILSTEALLNA